MPPRSWCREDRSNDATTLTLCLHVQPGAARSEVAGHHGDALKVRLAAPAIEGKANAELIRFLAEAFAVPRRAVTLLGGERSRDKRVRIAEPRQRPDRDWGKAGQ